MNFVDIDTLYFLFYMIFCVNTLLSFSLIILETQFGQQIARPTGTLFHDPAIMSSLPYTGPQAQNGAYSLGSGSGTGDVFSPGSSHNVPPGLMPTQVMSPSANSLPGSHMMSPIGQNFLNGSPSVAQHQIGRYQPSSSV